MSGRLHLSAKHQGVLEALLRAHLPDVGVWAYGSRVNGRCHAGSDLDLVIRGPAWSRSLLSNWPIPRTLCAIRRFRFSSRHEIGRGCWIGFDVKLRGTIWY